MLPSSQTNMSCFRPPYWFPLLIIFHIILLTCSLVSSDQQDPQRLITFKDSLTNTVALSNWDPKVAPCASGSPKWNGMICNPDGSVFGLRLENMGLSGNIDMDTLAEVTSIRSLSFMNNSFEGSMPNIQKIGSLRAIFLSNNKFSGEIGGDAFNGMASLRKVELANNNFGGKIPISLARLPILVDLQLQDNQFDGEIPDFEQKDLKVNFANNKLDGSIPKGLRNQDPGSFEGNNLCGKPLNSCKKKLNKKMIIIIIAGASFLAVLVAIIITLFIIRSRRRRKIDYKNRQVTKTNINNAYKHNANNKVIQMHTKVQDQTIKRSDNGGKLHFVRTDRERFELEDLLRASADVLGSGSFGSSYKAMLAGRAPMVVKRFKEMGNVGKEDFYGHMRMLGSLSHPNLLPLVAFYYKKEEKLLVTDFAANGSLASHLHVTRRPDEPGLDWPTRLKIIKGVARGLDYLYQELPRLSLPHGHLKSSNVLLDDEFNPLLSDYALVPVINKDHAQHLMVAYKSPEFTQHGHTTKKTDVWCLGILILEMLTGKFPANYLEQGKGGKPDLGTWVNSVVREEWTGEVFDKEMKGTKNREGEMLKLLKIGMSCCEWDVARRCDIRDAVEKIEGLKERDDDEEFSSYASEGDAYSSRAMEEDNFSFSVTS